VDKFYQVEFSLIICQGIAVMFSGINLEFFPKVSCVFNVLLLTWPCALYFSVQTQADVIS